jgi:hypothetical protein
MMEPITASTRVSVTSDRQIELPSEIQAILQTGDEYVIFQTEDTLTVKKVNRLITFAEMTARINDLGVDPEEPTLQEISLMVREVRHGQFLGLRS